MKILLWHGYLMRGSGSNIYTANVARVWRRQGHDVLLMCQERHPELLEFVDAWGDFDESNESFSTETTGAAAASGRCTIVRPNIGEILPVYVFDEYEGFTAKKFVDLTEEELQHYIDTNVKAMVAAIKHHSPDVIVTGHEVMGPYIAREACAATGTEFAAKLHGSALEYAVKVQDRYVEYARAGLGAAKRVTGGSEYMVREAGKTIPEVLERASVVNPGCDVDIFKPVERSRRDRLLVGYVGKFIVSKGVHNFLCSLGLTHGDPFDVVIVGYGGFEQELKDLAAALASGDREGALEIARAGDGVKTLDAVAEFLESGAADDAYFRRAAEITVEFPGRLDHEELSQVLPTWDITVAPSVLAEVFGMVGAEAAASGVLPVLPRHSGIGEIGSALEGALERPGLLTFDPADPVRDLAAALDRLLTLGAEERLRMDAIVSAYAHEHWSWEKVGDGLLAAAQGR